MGCNATRVVKPLDKGEKQLAAGFGGPGIIYTGAPIPVPLTSVSYAHGLDTGLTLSAGLHTTSAAFGVIQSDIAVGISAFQSKSEKFGGDGHSSHQFPLRLLRKQWPHISTARRPFMVAIWREGSPALWRSRHMD